MKTKSKLRQLKLTIAKHSFQIQHMDVLQVYCALKKYFTKQACYILRRFVDEPAGHSYFALAFEPLLEMHFSNSKAKLRGCLWQ